jgi:hypothetical protein
MGTVQKDISFKTFIESVKNVALTDYTKNEIFEIKHSEVKVQSPDQFHEMRQHILKHYDGTDVVKSFQDNNGQVWDCIPVEHQPSLKGGNKNLVNAPDLSHRQPEAKNTTDVKKTLATSFLSKDKKDKYGNELSCPTGCIPVRRMTLEEMMKYETLQNFLRKIPKWNRIAGVKPAEADTSTEVHKYAHAAQQVNNLGGHSFLSLNQPVVQADQVFSLSQHWYTAGDGDHLQTLEAGWQVYPAKYKTMEPCLFIYYTGDNYKSIGAYNLEDGAFCQTNNKWALGGPLNPFVNQEGVAIYEVEISWSLVEGNWWLFINGTTPDDAVGYYPVSVYRGGHMSSHANYIDYGGETVGSSSWPPMGNGKFPDTNDSGYQRSINYYDLSGNGIWANLSPSEDFKKCYRIRLENNDSTGTFFYYGGPGGSSC